MVLDPRNQNELIEADSCSTVAVFPQGRMQSQEQWLRWDRDTDKAWLEQGPSLS